VLRARCDVPRCAQMRYDVYHAHEGVSQRCCSGRPRLPRREADARRVMRAFFFPFFALISSSCFTASPSRCPPPIACRHARHRRMSAPSKSAPVVAENMPVRPSSSPAEVTSRRRRHTPCLRAQMSEGAIGSCRAM